MKALILILVVAIGAFGQTPSPSPADYSDSDDAPPNAKPTKPNESPRTLDEMKAAAKAHKIKDDLIFAYDKFKDESRIMSKPHNLVGSWEGVGAIMSSSPMGSRGPSTPRILMVSIETRFSGMTLRQTPDKFLLVFDGMSPDWQFLKTGDVLYVLFDGDKRMQLEAVATDRDIVRYNRVDEKVAYVITREQATTLSTALKVELRIGMAKTRELKPNVRRGWRAVLDITKLEPEQK